MQKQIRCPDCRQMVDSADLKDHVIMCKLYVTRVYPSTIRLADHMNQENLRFLLVELDMARDRIKDKLGIKEEPVELKTRKNQSVHSNGNGHGIVLGTYQSVKLNDDNVEPLVPSMKQIKQKTPAPINKPKLDEEQFDLQKYLNRKSQTLQNLSKKQKDQGKQNLKDKDKQNSKNNQNNTEITIITKNGSSTNPQNVQMVACSNCKKQISANEVNLFVYNFTCLHLFCLNCATSYAIDQYIPQKGNLKCLVKDCKAHFEADEVRQILGAEQLDKLETEMLRSTMEFVKCCRCSHEYVFVEGNAKDAPKTDSDGKKITKQQADHYAKNRFLCSQSKCKQQQCKLCHATPYHLGRSCSENEQFKTAKKCRYCRDVLKKGYVSNLGIKAFDDVCPKKNCEKLTKNACSKVHKCKHSCYGYIRESKCLPCLNQACIKKQKIVQHDQDQDSYCSICYVEDLKAGPCVMSKCGHIFHYSCLQKRLQIRWLTPRILFGFCHCPLCKEWIQLPADCGLSVRVNNFKQLHKTIQQKSLNRLKFEKLEKDPKLTDSKSSYYQKPTDYAMAIYAYFECFKCKKPYFGGRKSCAEMMNEQVANPGNSRHDFDAEKLICPECCPVQAKNCIKHGKQFIAFKCRFCCNIGMWFCWGSTHFCDDCHKRQLSGEYVSKLSKDKLPKCQGKEKCPLGGDHPENGNQFSLGCSICRNQRAEAARDF